LAANNTSSSYPPRSVGASEEEEENGLAAVVAKIVAPLAPEPVLGVLFARPVGTPTKPANAPAPPAASCQGIEEESTDPVLLTLLLVSCMSGIMVANGDREAASIEVRPNGKTEPVVGRRVAEPGAIEDDETEAPPPTPAVHIGLRMLVVRKGEEERKAEGVAVRRKGGEIKGDVPSPDSIDREPPMLLPVPPAPPAGSWRISIH
jgi:hypothetical protein